MKKVVTLLVLVFTFTLTTQAQKRHKRGNVEKLSVAQQTDLAVKKMTLKLDLTESQQRQIRPLIAEKTAKRKAMRAERKAMKEKKQKPTADERYKKQADRLDEMIAFKADMKRILNEKQFAKFQKSLKHKKGKMKRKMKKRKMHKKRKAHKEEK